MKKIWLKSYPKGVPAEIDVGNCGTLVDMLEDSFRKYEKNTAYILMDKGLTYGEMDEGSKAMAAYLQGLGLKPGDRVAIMMPNVLQYPIALAGILRAGMIVVNVNPLYTPRELKHQLNDSGSKAIIILENFAATLEAVISETDIKHTMVASIGEMLGFLKGTIVNFVIRTVKKAVPSFTLPGHVKFNKAIDIGRGGSFIKPKISPDDVAILQYTGGTTGLSKGATLLHKTIVSAVFASEYWVKPALDRNPPSGQVTYICALPLYHVFALISCALLSMRMGGLNILIPNPRDMDASIKEMAKYDFHFLPAVNTLFNGLLNNPAFSKLDFSHLCGSTGGGMAVQSSVAQEWFDVTGCAICEGYGLSETSSGITCNPTNLEKFTGTIGLPMPGVDVKIIGEDGKEVKLGERGEIVIKGPQVMAGYWENPEATKSSMTKDGYFKSGDVGVMDKNGYFKIVDRIKDMILVSGFNVYPNEIEEVASSHPGVLEAAVVGVPDEKTGEAVMLFAILKDKSLTENDLRIYCKDKLAGYKKPVIVEFRDDLPRTNVGKVLRRELRDEALKMMTSKS